MRNLFISSIHDDKAAVTKILDRLRDVYYFDVWLASATVPGTDDRRKVFERKIDEADAVLVMLSPDACASEDVKAEINHAKARGRTIIPLQIKRVTPADLSQLGIAHFCYIDFMRDSRKVWDELLHALVGVSTGDQRPLDPTSWSRHTSSLRTLFLRGSQADLTSLLDASPGAQRDVYELLLSSAVQHGLDLWRVVQAILPTGDSQLPTDPADPCWLGMVYAGRLMRDHLPPNDERQETFRSRLREGLKRLIGLGALEPVERAEAGRILAYLGDPRPGVLACDGIPQLEWCEVPAGRFQMGGNPNTHYLLDGAEFNLPFPFWVAKYPITYAQYEPFVTSGGYRQKRWWTAAGWKWKQDRMHPESNWHVSRWHIPNCPVIGVTWYEANAYTRWLNEQLGTRPAKAPVDYVIRLARECEWEKAARFPGGHLYPWGHKWDEGQRVNWGESMIGRTSTVGIFPDGASPNQAHDLLGNVWEWCLTRWATKYVSPESEGNDPEGEGHRCIRGGAWNDVIRDNLRTTTRNWLYPNIGLDYVGFRVVVSIPI